MTDLNALNKLVEDAEKIINSFDDSYWKTVPTFAQISWTDRRHSNYRKLSIVVTSIHSQFRDWRERRVWEKKVGNIWNRRRREVHKRTGYDKVLKQEKQAKIIRKKKVFDDHRDKSIEIMRKLVSELVLYEHLLRQDQVSERKARDIQYLSGRLSWYQKELIKAAKGTDCFKK